MRKARVSISRDDLHERVWSTPMYGVYLPVEDAPPVFRHVSAPTGAELAELMQRMGIEASYRKPRTSFAARGAYVYPYLLGGLAIERANQVWSADITYLPMAHGFQYLVAILDVASRKVLAWRLSNTMTADFCVEALEDALSRHGAPEIFDTDQDAQFTGDEWLGTLKAAGSTTCSSSGCGAASSTKRSTRTPTRTAARLEPASRSTSSSTTLGARISRTTIGRRMRCTVGVGSRGYGRRTTRVHQPLRPIHLSRTEICPKK